jgi:hypothetical protein
MTHSPKRLAAALSPVPLGVAAAALAGVLAGYGSSPTLAAVAHGRDTVPAATQRSAAPAGAATVVVNCLNKRQVRPASFVLTCADGNDVLTGMRWVNWASEAFATGTEKINNCTPNCAEGKFISYPALVTLWRPEPLPHHPGVRYFSRVTRIYTGKRPPRYDCHGSGTPACHPVTATTGLWGHLGG